MPEKALSYRTITHFFISGEASFSQMVPDRPSRPDAGVLLVQARQRSSSQTSSADGSQSRRESFHRTVGACFFKKMAITGLFYYLFSSLKQLTVNMFTIKLCWCLDLNRGSLVSEATALTTQPQPLPTLGACSCKRITVVKSQRLCQLTLLHKVLIYGRNLFTCYLGH